MLSSMAQDLSGQPWYVQAMATKLLPIIENATKSEGSSKSTQSMGLGLQK